MICCLRIRMRDIRSNIALRLAEFPRARPKGTPKGGGLYFTVYPESSTGIIDSPYTPWGKYGMFCVLDNTLGWEAILKELSSNIPLLRIINFLMLMSRNLLAIKQYYWFLPKNNDINYVTKLFFLKTLIFTI